MRQLIFRKQYFVGISELPEKQQLETYDAIMRYAFNGEFCEVSKECVPLLSMIIESINRDFDRYDSRQKDER